MASKRLTYVWCIFCFYAYMKLPMSKTHDSLYGRLNLWLLGYAGLYAHSKGFADFCNSRFFEVSP